MLFSCFGKTMIKGVHHIDSEYLHAEENSDDTMQAVSTATNEMSYDSSQNSVKVCILDSTLDVYLSFLSFHALISLYCIDCGRIS